MVLTVHRWFANKSCPEDWLYSRLGDLASKVTAALGGSSSETAGSVLYRVRKSWSNAKSQKDAFNTLDNAKKCADSNAGYSVFDESGKVVTPENRLALEVQPVPLQAGVSSRAALAGFLWITVSVFK